MDRELVLAIVGIGVAFVALGGLSIYQQARAKREKQEKARTVSRSLPNETDAPPGESRFFIACHAGNKARFFRVYLDQKALLFLYAGPLIAMLGPEMPRGTDTRHWAIQSARLLAIGLAAGAVAALVAWFSAGGFALAIIALLVVGFMIAVPLVVRRILARGAELDGLSLQGLREQAELDDWSFRAEPDNVSDLSFEYLELGSDFKRSAEIGARLKFQHKPTGRWKIETMRTRDTLDAISACREVFGREAVKVDPALEPSPAGTIAPKPPRKREPTLREIDRTTTRPYGFPRQMLVGFILCAGLATLLAFAWAPDGRRLMYTTFSQLVFSLGWLGIYTGHVIGVYKTKDCGLEPWGMAPSGAWLVGVLIWFVGCAVVLVGVSGVMYMLYGPPPH